MNEQQVKISQAELLPAQIERLDNRLTQIEKIAATVESIAEKGIDAATKYLQSKAETERQQADAENEQHKREIELQDKQHKRSIVVLSMAVLVVFSLIVIAMFMGQFELVKLILTSSLALAGGLGLSKVFKSSQSDD